MIAIFFSIIITWLLEVLSEEQSGSHTIEVQKGFQYAIILFILSELMLFFSFF
jgi:heme/copper-type cytochrome/quinol oxidase subunit 3